VVSEPQRHRRVEPDDVGIDTVRGDELVDQRTLQPACGVVGAWWQMRHHDVDAAIFRDGQPRIRTGVGVVERFFDEEHAPLFGAAGHQMLRTLKHEVPPEMRKANQIVG
jgi:hypothetical protein